MVQGKKTVLGVSKNSKNRQKSVGVLGSSFNIHSHFDVNASSHSPFDYFRAKKHLLLNPMIGTVL